MSKKEAIHRLHSRKDHIWPVFGVIEVVNKNVLDSASLQFVSCCTRVADNGKLLASSLARVWRDSPGSFVLISTSDYSHAGKGYRDVPPEGVSIREYANQQLRAYPDSSKSPLVRIK